MGGVGCASNPCKNGGKCIRIGDYGKYFCKCKKAFIESATCESYNRSTYKSVYFIDNTNKWTTIRWILLILNAVLVVFLIVYLIKRKMEEFSN
jgi:hypothetical protein